MPYVSQETYGLYDRVDVGAGLAVQLLLCAIRLDQQQIGASRAKVHGKGLLKERVDEWKDEFQSEYEC